MAVTKEVEQWITELAKRLLGRAFRDWEEMIGLDCKLLESATEGTASPPDLCVELGGPAVIIETRVEGEYEGPLRFAFPVSFAARVVGTMVMLPAEIIKEKELEGLSSSDLEAFREMANLLCGSSNNELQDMNRDIRVSQNVEHLRVRLHGTDADPADDLSSGEFAVSRNQVKLGEQTFPVVQVLSAELAMSIVRRPSS